MKSCHLKAVSSPCKSEQTFASRYPAVFGFIILILPKCPFCLVAYSSAITLCGTSTLITRTTHHAGGGAYIALLMGVVIASCILFTNKNKSYYSVALAMAFTGLLLLSIGIFKTDAMLFYYSGAALLVMATFIYSRVLRTQIERLKNRFSEMSNQVI
jgi:hypothetical protein